jgi:hypothetical protein
MYQNKEKATCYAKSQTSHFLCLPTPVGRRVWRHQKRFKKRYCPAFGSQAWHYKAGFFYAPAGKGRQAYVSVQAGLMCTFWSV